MYQTGDYVIYENNGVCRVDSIGPIDSPIFDRKRVYYTLCPVNRKESRIFTPVDNDKINIRPIMTKEEAMDMIDDINTMELLWIPEERKREAEYRMAVQKCDCRELVRIIKTIYLRKQERLADGKKITAVDEKYFAMAEDRLYEELGTSLEMEKAEVKLFVENRVKQQEEQLV